MNSKSCGDGDFSFKKMVKWLFQPKKVGDLVILLNCGDGDFGAIHPLLEFSPSGAKCWLKITW